METFNFSRPVNGLTFVGAHSTVAFDRIEIRETVNATLGNQYFGNFLLGTAPAPAPAPGSLALLAVGLIAAAGAARRRR